MNYTEIKEICRKGGIGLIPRWLGYLKWDYGRDELKFVNGDYTMWQKELEGKISNRIDLYYII